MLIGCLVFLVKASCSMEQLCYMILWHLLVILFYRWLYWHQCTNWAHSFCVHTIKMHSIALYLLQASWSTQMVQFSQRFMCITQCLTMFPLNSSHYSSLTCKFSSVYTIFQCRDERQCRIGSQQSTKGDGFPVNIPPVLYFMNHHHLSHRYPSKVSQLLFSVGGDICRSTWLH